MSLGECTYLDIDFTHNDRVLRSALEYQHGLGLSASIVETGLFNIPIDIAIILSNMYRH